MDTNFNMGDGMSTHDAQGTSNISSSSVPFSIVLSSIFETTIIDTSTSLPPFISLTHTLLPTSTLSPKFSNIMDQHLKTEVDQEDDDFMVSFGDIQFVPEEENIPDHLLMSGKQLKILNRKLNSLLQIQVDTRSPNTVFGIKIDVLLKYQEHRLKAQMEHIETKHEECLKLCVENFQYEVKELHKVAKERLTVFEEEVHKIEQAVNIKVKSLNSDFSKELSKLKRKSFFY